MIYELPRMKYNGKEYLIDPRLEELRNVDNPHDRIPFDSEEDLPAEVYEIVSEYNIRRQASFDGWLLWCYMRRQLRG